MKRIKQRLFPVLTCLIVLFSAVHPARLSRIRDGQQLYYVHTEEMTEEMAGFPPAQDPPSLAGRVALFASQSSLEHTILAYEMPIEAKSQRLSASIARRSWDTAEKSGLFSSVFLEGFIPDSAAVYQLMLWDPEKRSDFQEPVTFWRVSWNYFEPSHSKHLSLVIDPETETPVWVDVFDTNLAQWLPYRFDALYEFAERYLDLAGWTFAGEIQEEWEAPQHTLSYPIPDSGIRYVLTHRPTALTVLPEQEPENDGNPMQKSGGSDGET